MLFLPKLWSFLLLLTRPRMLKSYGGMIRAALSVFFESVFSMLTAPILMLYQSKFVVAILLRRSVGWPPQNRGDHRLSLKEATLAHGGQTLTGLGAGWLSYEYMPDFFLWLVPVLAGLVLAVPISILSSSTKVGLLARKLGFFMTPEEYRAPRVVELLHENLAKAEQSVAQAEGELNVADPGTYSLHLALLPDRPIKKRQRHQLRAWVYQLVEDGPETLSAAEKRALISDPETLTRLHTLAWSWKDNDTPQSS
jgi:membrane glycosyltransferase